MLSLRRYTTHAALAIIFLIILTHFRHSIASHARVQYATYFSPPKKHSDGKFHWSDVPIRYPIESLTSLPTAAPRRLPKVQYAFSPESAEQAALRQERQAAVKTTFRRCWTAYTQHAWMMDEVTPITSHFKNGFGGWAATLVDSLDTLWIMDLKDEFEQAVEAAMTIDLSQCTEETINVFETNIRHLGGFLSAYDLSGDKRLLDKALEFGEMLLKAFDTPNHLPITRWKPQKALTSDQVADDAVLVAEIGSLTMEFTHLSQLTGDMRFYDAVDRIMKLFTEQQEDTHLPGMFPVVVNGRDADFTRDTYFTLSAMSDSLYEYFPKMHALLGGTEPMYSHMYTRSMEVAIKHNLWKPMTPDEADILVSGNVRVEMGKKPKLEAQGQHLVCFAGGMFALGGRLMQKDLHLEIGKKLTNGCIWTYEALPMGIMPEVFEMIPCDSWEACPWDENQWRQKLTTAGIASTQEEIDSLRLPKGFTKIHDRRYILRPEAIESVFILYRISGESYLLDKAWNMFVKIVNATETNIANAALADVTYDPEWLSSTKHNVKMDSMESFWLAETLKYFYLIFSPQDTISLDEWVFNTEAHPFRRPKASS